MMINVEINFRGVKSAKQFHALMKKTFGFPDFYGANYPALVDCLSSLRFPAHGMSFISLPDESDVLNLECKGLLSCDRKLIEAFYDAVHDVNQREIEQGRATMIVITVIK